MEEALKPPRVVGKPGAMLMSVNGMIGAGIFALPALLYDEVGGFAPWLFLIFGILFAAGVSGRTVEITGWPGIAAQGAGSGRESLSLWPRRGPG